MTVCKFILSDPDDDHEDVVYFETSDPDNFLDNLEKAAMAHYTKAIEGSTNISDPRWGEIVPLLDDADLEPFGISLHFKEQVMEFEREFYATLPSWEESEEEEV